MHLSADEKIIYSTRFSGRIFVTPLIVALVFFVVALIWKVIEIQVIVPEVQIGMYYSGIVFIIVGCYAFVRPFIKYIMSRFVITNKRIIIQYGLLAKRSYEMMLTKIESISVNQSFTDRFLWRSGTLVITGTGGTKEAFPEVGRAIIFQKKLNEVLHAKGNMKG